jgi:Fe-S cluster assembly protein SufD
LDFKLSFRNPSQFTSLNDFDKDAVFTTLNAGLFHEAIVIKAEAKKEIKAPLQLIFVNQHENIIANNRIQIIAEKGSNSNLIFTHISLTNAKNNFSNTILDIVVEENAHLNIDTIQAENNSSLSVSTAQIKQAKHSTFKINTFVLGGLLVRNNINISVDGENCESFMNGAVIARESQFVDNHTFVNHRVPNCYSNENYKYVLDGKSTGVFNGKVIVQQDAQVINAYQNNGNILLSDDAKIYSKPELEIYADDVKCSHGSTTGQLDEAALFYLQARGICLENAKKILVSAFIGEVLESTKIEAVSDLVKSILQKEFSWNF